MNDCMYTPRTTQGEWKPNSFSDCGRYVWGSFFCQVLILALRYVFDGFCSTLEIQISGGFFEKNNPKQTFFAPGCCFSLLFLFPLSLHFWEVLVKKDGPF